MTTQKHDDSQNYQSVIIPVAGMVDGNSAPHNPAAVNPLRDAESPAPAPAPTK